MRPVTTPPADLVDACGDDPGRLCEWVFDVSGGNRIMSGAADWLIGRPLAVIVVILCAWLARVIARWLVRRVVRRMMVPPDLMRRPLGALRLAAGQTPTPAAAQDIEQARRKARSESIGGALASTAGVIIWFVAAIVSAGILGLEAGQLLAGAGVVGVAVGFGAQSLVRDCINGVFILLEDQYGIGDSVDLGAASGTVERVSLRTTVLRGLDGTVWHVPNGETRRVGNRSQLWSVAIVDVQVAYDTDLTTAQQVISDAANAVCTDPDHSADILEAPRVLGVESMTADAVQLRLVVKTTPGTQWALERLLRVRIKQALEANDIPVSSLRPGPT